MERPNVAHFLGCQWFTQIYDEGPGRPNRIVVSFFFKFSEGKNYIFLFLQMTFMLTRPGEMYLRMEDAQSIRFNGELK